MPKSSKSVLASLLSLLVAASIALAQPPAAPPAAAQPAPAAPAAPAGSAAELAARATALAQQGDLAGAAALLEPLRADPKVPAQVRALLGGLYVELRRPADALDVLAPLVADENADPAALYNAGRAALLLGRRAAADRFLARSVAKARVSPAARLLGELRLDQERWQEAYDLLRPWALANPGDRGALFGAIFCALELKRPSEARELLARLPADDPRARLFNGRILLVEEKPAEAAEALAPLVSGPDAEALWASDPLLAAEMTVARAGALATVGQTEKAAAELEALTRRKPDHAVAWAMHGELLGKLGRTEEAKRASDRAAELARAAEQPPSPADQHLRRAFELDQQDKDEEALAEIRLAIAAAPDDLRARLLEVRKLVDLKRAAEALPKAEEVVRIAPQNADAVYLRGVAKMSSGDLAGAEADLRRALELAPAHTAAMNDLAVALMAAGRNAEARTLLERLLVLRPGDALAAKNLERLKSGGSP